MPNPDCRTAYPSVAVQVYPPGETHAIRYRVAGRICDLRVGFVVAG